MSKNKEKEIAIQMRKNGQSIKGIAKKLNISTSTSSRWCKNIPIPITKRRILNQKQEDVTRHAFQVNNANLHRRKLNNIEIFGNKGKKMVNNLTERDLFILGLGLYWSEGYKKGNDEFGFTNSDPDMIRIFIQWIEEIFSIEKEQLILRISVNQAHKHREAEIINFWSRLLKIPKTQFTKTSFIQSISKKVYENAHMYYGTLRIKVRKGTNLRRTILGAIDRLRTL